MPSRQARWTAQFSAVNMDTAALDHRAILWPREKSLAALYAVNNDQMILDEKLEYLDSVQLYDILADVLLPMAPSVQC